MWALEGRTEPVAQPVTSCHEASRFRRLWATAERERGDEQGLATVRNREGTGPRVSASHRAQRQIGGMARTLRIDTAASPSLLLQRARRAARTNGVLLLGDENSGRFSHRMLEGNYRRQGRTVIVTITYKHRLVPCSVLEGRLRGLFGGGPPRKGRVSKKSEAPTACRSGGRRRASRRPPHHHRRHPPRR
jgi:hypothetical protein